MMGKIRGRIEKVAKKVGAVGVALALARGRVRHFNEIAHRAEDAAAAAEKRADQLRAEGQPGRAAKQDRKATRKKRRASNARSRRQVWIGRAKSLAQRKHDLKRHRAELEADLAAWQAKHQPRVEGKMIVGGELRERIEFALRLSVARCAAGQRPNRYSQPGAYSVDRLISGEPAGFRTDCSQFGSSVWWACGLEDTLNGEDFGGGYTGTIEREGTPCSVEYAKHHAGTAVVYGPPGRTFHVEFPLGDGTNRTAGHGSPPIDFGVIDLFGDNDFRCFKFSLIERT